MPLEPQAFLSTLEQRVGLNNEHKKLLQSESDWGRKIAPEMAEHFYAYLGRDAEMNGIVNDGTERTHRLRETFVEWFHEMFTGMDEWGKEYAQRRWKIGLVHVRIGIGPQHVVPAMATVIHEVEIRLETDEKTKALKDALSRICMIDLAFIEQAYVEVSSEAVLKETGWTAGLFRRLIATGAKSMN
jgi:Protoglobin